MKDKEEVDLKKLTNCVDFLYSVLDSIPYPVCIVIQDMDSYSMIYKNSACDYEDNIILNICNMSDSTEEPKYIKCKGMTVRQKTVSISDRGIEQNITINVLQYPGYNKLNSVKSTTSDLVIDEESELVPTSKEGIGTRNISDYTRKIKSINQRLENFILSRVDNLAPDTRDLLVKKHSHK